MNREHVVQLLEMLGADKITQSTEWVRASCLFAPWTHGKGTDSRPSFGISLGERSHYFCFSCQKSGPLTTLVTSLCMLRGRDNVEAREFVMNHEHLGLDAYENLEPVEPLSPLAPQILKRFPPAHMGLEFVQRRGITQEAIDHFQLRYDPANARLIIPIFDSYGRLVGIRGRATDDAKLRYKEYSELYPTKTSPKAHGIWFGMHFDTEPRKKIILVEGEIDAIRLWQVLKRGGIWASMGASLSKAQVKKVQGARHPVLMFFDGDEAGKLTTEKMQKKLVKVIEGVFKVTDYCGCKDPDELIQRRLLKRALGSIELVY